MSRRLAALLSLIPLGLGLIFVVGIARAETIVSVTVAPETAVPVGGEIPVFTDADFATNAAAIAADGIADGSVVRLPGVSDLDPITVELAVDGVLIDDATRTIGLPAVATVAGRSADLLVVAQWADDLSAVPSLSLGVHFEDLALSDLDASWLPPPNAPTPEFPDTWIALSTGDHDLSGSGPGLGDFYPAGFVLSGPGVSYQSTIVVQSALGSTATDALGYGPADVAVLRGSLGTTWAILNGDLDGTSVHLEATVPPAPGAMIGGWLQATADWTLTLDAAAPAGPLEFGLDGELTPAGDLSGAFPPVSVVGNLEYEDAGTVNASLSGTIGTWDDALGASWLDLTDVGATISFALDGGAATATAELTATFDADGAGGVDPFVMTGVLSGDEASGEVAATFTIDGSLSMAEIAALYAAQGTTVSFPGQDTLELRQVTFSVSTAGGDASFSVSAESTVLGAMDVEVLVGLTRTVGGENLVLLGVKTTDVSMSELFSTTSPGLAGSVLGELSMPGVDYTVVFPLDSALPPYEVSADDLSAAARDFYGQDVVTLHLEGNLSIEGTADLADFGPEVLAAFGITPDAQGRALVDYTGSADAAFDWGGGATFELEELDLTAALPDAELTLPGWLTDRIGDPGTALGDLVLHFNYDGDYQAEATTTITADIDATGNIETIDVTAAIGYHPGPPASYDVSVSGDIGTWEGPFGVDITVSEAFMTFAFSSGPPISASATIGGTIPVGTADLALTVAVSEDAGEVSADFTAVLDGPIPMSDVLALVVKQMGSSPDLGSSELTNLLVGPGTISIHVGTEPTFLVAGATSYDGYDADVLLWVRANGDLEFLTGVRISTPLTLGDLSDAFTSPIAEFELPGVTLVAANAAVAEASGDLDPGVFGFFKHLYGCEAADAQDDCEFDLEVEAGVSLLASTPLPASIAAFKDELWIDDNPVLLTGFIPVFGSTGEPSLEAVLPPITPPPGTDPAAWLKSGQLSFKISPSAFSLDGELTLLVGGDELVLGLSGAVDAAEASVTFTGSLGGLWTSPFDIDWLTIRGLAVELGVRPAVVTVGLFGAFDLGSRDFSGSVLVDIPPSGVPILRGVRGASASGVSSSDLVAFQTAVAGGGSGLDFSALPSLSLKNAEFSYSTVDNPTLCLQQGIILAGDLYVNPIAGAGGAAAVPDGPCEQIPPRPLPSEFCIDHRIEGCFASVRMTVDEQGIAAAGSLGAFTLGDPAVLVWDDAAVDLVVDVFGAQRLELSGAAEVPGFLQGYVALEVTSNGRAFEGEFEIYGLFFAYVDGSFTTLSPTAPFDLSEAGFRIHGIMRSGFSAAVSSAAEPFLSEVRSILSVVGPLFNDIVSLSTSPDPLAVLAGFPARLQAVGLPAPQILVDIAGAVGDFNTAVNAATLPFQAYIALDNEIGILPDITVPNLALNPAQLVDVALNGYQFPSSFSFSGAAIPFVPELCSGGLGTWVGGTCYTVAPTSTVYATVCAPWPFDDECASIPVFPATPGIPGLVTPPFCAGVVQDGTCYGAGLVPIPAPRIPGLCDLIPGVTPGTPACSASGLAMAALDTPLRTVIGDSVQIPPVPNLQDAVTRLTGLFEDPGSLFSLQCAEFDANIDALQGSRTVTMGLSAEVLGNQFGLSAGWNFDDPAGSAFALVKQVLVTVLNGQVPSGPPCAPLDSLVPPPQITAVNVTSTIVENDLATISGSFTSDPSAAHSVVIDWKDGPPQTINLGPGVLSFSANHRYLDDGRSATASDRYFATVTVTNPATGSTRVTRTIDVHNDVPVVSASVASSVGENGTVTLSGSFIDAGSLDSHTVVIDWGDGPATVLSLSGERAFAASHRYLDDNPSGTASDIYSIRVTVTDDDLGSQTVVRDVRVVNDPPSDLDLVFQATTLDEAGEFVDIPGTAIDEGDWITVTGTFTDDGSLDSHTVVIDWGDDSGDVTVLDSSGAPVLLEDTSTTRIRLQPGERSFTARHRFYDDNPTATLADTYPVTVTVTDDDGGSVSQSRQITVHNVAPFDVELLFGLLAIDENDTVVLNGTFSDPGVLDTHTVSVDWGDGTGVNTLVLSPPDSGDPASGGAVREFQFSHHYLDDNPTGTPSDPYPLTVTLIDDDGGVAPAGIIIFQAPVFDPATGRPLLDESGDLVTIETVDDTSDFPTVTVANVPSEVDFTVTPHIVENGTVTLDGWFVDPGTLDSHTVCIDWGDGRSASGELLGAPADFAGCADRTGRHVDVIEMPADPGRGFDVPREFGMTHQYLDDNPTGTSTDLYTVSVFVLDDDTQEGMADHLVRVDDVAPVISAAPVTQDPQYSDPLHEPIVYTVTDVLADTLVATTDWSYEGGDFQDGLPAALAFSFGGCSPGGFAGEVEPRQTCSWTVDGIVDVAPGIYEIRIKVIDDDGLFTYHSVEVDVQPEDARTFFSGPTVAAGIADDSGITRIPLRATIKDITVSSPQDPAWDDFPGDITHALVDFVNRETGEVLCSSAVDWVFATDEGRGTAACWWEVDLGTADALQVEVAVRVGGWYVRDDAAEDTTVSVVQPSKDHLTGGERLITAVDSAGIYAPDDGSEMKFKVNAKFKTRQGAWELLYGRVDIAFESNGRSYEIRTTAMDTLGLTSTGKNAGIAQLDVRVSLIDVTDKKHHIVIGEDLPLQVRITDNGSPGKGSDTIGLTLWGHDGRLLLSNGWDDVGTVEQVTDKGNLQVHIK